MRIVILDSDHEFVSGFKARCKKANVVCDSFDDSTQAITEIQKDPSAVNLFIVCRELAKQNGIGAAQMVRKDPATAHIPILLISSEWTKNEFAAHQKTDAGANSYYNKKTPFSEFEAAIESVTGFKFPSASGAQPLNSGQTGLINVNLLPADEVVNIREEVPSGISLEKPINLFQDQEEEVRIESKKPEEPISVGGAGAGGGDGGQSTGPVEVSIEITESEADVKQMQIETTGAPGTDTSIALQRDQSASIETAAPVVSGPTQTAAQNIVVQNATIESPEIKAEGELKVDGEVKVDTNVKAAVNVIDTVENSEELSVRESVKSIEMPKAPTETSMEANEPPPEIPAAPEHPVVASEPQASNDNPSETISKLRDVTKRLLARRKKKAEEPQGLQEPSEPEVSGISEEEAAKELPYLFNEAKTSENIKKAVEEKIKSIEVPNIGNTTDDSDVATLKQYLSMREQDLAVLKVQLDYAKNELAKSEETIKRVTFQNEDLYVKIEDLKKKNKEFENQQSHADKSLEREVEELRQDLKAKIDRIKYLEDRLKGSAEEYEKLKERVRIDIRKIRVREKELESKLEILKRDSETLISGRENKILELKRKIDLLEFNYDTLLDKNELEKQKVADAKDKQERIVKVLKLALGVLESESEEGVVESKTGTDINVA